MSDYRYCIVGEAWGFRGIYMYSWGGGNPYHCPRCIDLSREISDAYYLSLEKSKDLGDAISAFVDHWNEKHREKAPINQATSEIPMSDREDEEEVESGGDEE